MEKRQGKNHSNERFVKRWTQPVHEAVKNNFSQVTGGGLTRCRKKQNKTKSNTRSRRNRNRNRNQSGGFLRAGHRYYYTPQLSNPPATQLQDNMSGVGSATV